MYPLALRCQCVSAKSKRYSLLTPIAEAIEVSDAFCELKVAESRAESERVNRKPKARRVADGGSDERDEHRPCHCDPV